MMMKDLTPHSIFNDVLGPIMAGPSSSHSAGCARIGRTVRLLYGKEIRKAVVVFDAAGSYPSTYIGQGSNFGFTGGLLGFGTDHPQLKDAVQLAREQGADITFAQEMLSHRHPNEARIDVYGPDGTVEMNALTFSTGGGTFQIVELDGYPVLIDGSCRQVFVECTAEGAPAAREALQKQGFDPAETAGKAGVLLTVKGIAADREAALDALAQLPGVQAVRHSGSVLPVAIKGTDAVFTSAKTALEYSKAHGGLTAPELALAYETSLGEVTEEDVRRTAQHTIDVMRRATIPPDPATTPKFGFLPYRCRGMDAARKTRAGAAVGCLDQAMIYAVAVMENSCAHNTVVAAPTAGSSGVIPGALFAVGESLGCTEEEILQALLASGLTGAFIANQATFAAEAAGCQAENGAASAMAAAGVVQLLGGTVEQGFMAASMALQNMLGLICDPVGGLTEIPCISRNISAISNAVTAANMVLYGFDPMIPLDETIRSMYEVGQQLPPALRCTCEGGLCTTPTGKCLACGLHR